jgi:hypothetical protein
MITINITPEQLEAIKIALTEASNSGDWAGHYSEDQVENVFATAKYFETI